MNELEKLAKEKGFHIPLKPIGQWNNIIKDFTWIDDGYLWLCALQKWICKNYPIYIDISYDFITYDVQIHDMRNESIPIKLISRLGPDAEYTFTKYEDALKVGLQEALKLIET